MEIVQIMEIDLENLSKYFMYSDIRKNPEKCREASQASETNNKKNSQSSTVHFKKMDLGRVLTALLWINFPQYLKILI